MHDSLNYSLTNKPKQPETEPNRTARKVGASWRRKARMKPPLKMRQTENIISNLHSLQLLDTYIPLDQKKKRNYSFIMKASLIPSVIFINLFYSTTTSALPHFLLPRQFEQNAVEIQQHMDAATQLFNDPVTEISSSLP